MSGRNVHLFAAAIAFAVAGTSAASAGVIDGSNWGPTRWSCGSQCGPMPTIIYGPYSEPVYYPERLYPVNQGPVYQPPLLPYGEESIAPGPDQRRYPYVSPYGGYGFPYMYPGYRYGGGYHRPHGYRYGPHRYVGHRPVMRMPMVRRGPMGGSRWHN